MQSPERIGHLRRQIAGLVDWSLPLETRAHPLHGFQRLNASFFIKRDDEAGLPGGKMRKYAALLPFIRRHGFQEVVIVGGAYANNVAALAAMLRSQQVGVHCFLRGEPEAMRPVGNQLLLQLLAGPEDITWVPRSHWREVLHRAHTWAEARRAAGRKVLVTPEGATIAPVTAGLCTLLLDILRNEQALGLTFDHIVLDAGTGATAAVTTLLSQYLGLDKTYHIVLAAGDAVSYSQQVEAFRAHLEVILEAALPPPAQTHVIERAAAFGRVSQADLARIRRVAHMEGVFLDPVYTVRSYAYLEETLARQPLTGNVLLVHSGGWPGFWGYADALASG